MFKNSEKYYDLIYRFKNYKSESEKIKEIIHNLHPSAKSVLDIGCATGEHLKYLTDSYDVSGFDLNPGLISIAKEKLPDCRFWVQDMSNFDLGVKFDIILCLYSVVGYLHSKIEIINSFINIKKHLNPGGFIILEPWYTPDKWNGGIRKMVTVDEPFLKISRIGKSSRVGSLEKLEFQYLVATDKNIDHFKETHELTMYTVEDMKECFKKAGFKVEFDQQGFSDRGLYTASIQNSV